MNIKFFILLITLALPFVQIHGQSNSIDSLYKEITQAHNDTSKVNAAILYGELILNQNPKKAKTIWEESLRIVDKNLEEKSQEEKFLKQKGTLLNNLAFIMLQEGKMTEALKYWKLSLNIQEKTNDQLGMALSYNNIGGVMLNQGNLELAIQNFHASLVIYEKTNHIEGRNNCLNNIGSVYVRQGENSKGLEYFLKSIDVEESYKTKPFYTATLINIGLIYSSLKDYFNSYKYFNEALNIAIQINDKKVMANLYNNLGFLYGNYGDPTIKNKDSVIKQDQKTAIEYYLKSLEIKRENNLIEDLPITLLNLGASYYKLGQKDKAFSFINESLEMSYKLGYPYNIKSAAYTLKEIYKREKNYKLALEMYELEVKMNDSLINEASRKASIKSQLKYEYEKQAAADSVSHAKESEVKNAELAKQSAEIKAKKNQQYALFGGLGLVMVFAGFMFNRFKVTQKQKEIIENQKEIVEEQKKLVEEKQKEVLDSIHYARKIQMAQIPNNLQVELSINRCIKK
ncbi:MAG: tetratricopeptide repeat protein [Sphingobacteriaceae bacterium]|nr:tetratricopeptide repeat protein [Sphingobacteriaceae bacterium]